MVQGGERKEVETYEGTLMVKEELKRLKCARGERRCKEKWR